MKLKYACILALFSLLLAHSVSADEVITIDGARLVGNITLIDTGTIHLDTSYAGTLKIAQEQVASFSTELPRVVRLESGTVMAGPIESSTNGKLKIKSEDGVLETNTTKVAATWSPATAASGVTMPASTSPDAEVTSINFVSAPAWTPSSRARTTPSLFSSSMSRPRKKTLRPRTAPQAALPTSPSLVKS